MVKGLQSHITHLVTSLNTVKMLKARTTLGRWCFVRNGGRDSYCKPSLRGGVEGNEGI